MENKINKNKRYLILDILIGGPTHRPEPSRKTSPKIFNWITLAARILALDYRANAEKTKCGGGGYFMQQQ